MKQIILSLLLFSSVPVFAQMKDGQRDPRVTAFERKIFSQYGTCYKCGRPWNCCHEHSVEYTKNWLCFALCEDCWNDSDLEMRKKYYAMCYEVLIKRGEKRIYLDSLMINIARQSQNQ